MKLHDFGAGLTVVPVPAGFDKPIHGSISGKMFAIEDQGKLSFYYFRGK